MAKWSSFCLLALIALASAWLLAGCGGSDGSGSDQSKTVASAGRERSGADSRAAAIDQSGSTSHGSGDQASSGSAPPSGPAAVTPGGPGETTQDQFPPEALRDPKKPHKAPKSHSGGKSGGNSTTGLSPQESATYEAARALCANPDSLQYAPEGIRNDAEALAKFAEGFAPAGEEQVVHDGCLVGLKSIGID